MIQQQTSEMIEIELNNAGAFFENVGKSFISFLPTLIFALIVLILGVVITKLVLFIISKGMKKSMVDKTASGFINSLVRIVLYLLVLSIVLTILGVPVDSLIAIIASGAVAIGLALQSSLSNFAGGIILLFSKPCKVGDIVEVNGISGEIERINLIYTEIKTFDNRMVYVPNGQMTNSNIINASVKEIRRVDSVFSVSYSDDYKKAIDIINGVIDGISEVLKNEERFVRVSGQTDDSVEITVRIWTKSENYWTVYFDLLERVKDSFIREGMTVPSKNVDIHIKEKV